MKFNIADLYCKNHAVSEVVKRVGPGGVRGVECAAGADGRIGSLITSRLSEAVSELRILPLGLKPEVISR